jgi:hypothetical protein
MNIYWKDIEEIPGKWSGLALNFESSTKPGIHLESCENARIKLVNHGDTIFWATIEWHYTGVWLVKAYNSTEQNKKPIPPITADIINNLEYSHNNLRFWCKFFAESLIKSDSSVLYNGLWLFRPIEFKYDCTVSHGYQNSIFDCLRVYNVQNTFDREQIDWINWWTNGSCELINMKPKPDINSGRLKWWRKVAKENKLPPVLIWYLNCLDAYIIIDGHYRLYAALLENVKPDLILVYSVNEQNIITDKYRQEKIEKSLSVQIANHPESIDKINNVLIEAFDNRPYYKSVTHSQVVLESEKIWINEIEDLLLKINKLEKKDEILNRWKRRE